MAAANEIHKLVTGNGAQPGNKGTVRAPGVPLEMNRQQDFLQDIFSVGRPQPVPPKLGGSDLPQRRREVRQQPGIGLA